MVCSKTEKNRKTLMCKFTRVLLKRRNCLASKVEINNIMFLKEIMKGLTRVLLLALMGFFTCVYMLMYIHIDDM